METNEQLKPIFRDFLQSYFEKDASVSDHDWLKEKLKESGLELSDKELEKYTEELMGSIKSYSDSLRSLELSKAEGKTADEWLSEKIKESGKDITAEEMYRANISYMQANQRLLRNLKAEEVGQTVNTSAIDIAAEQYIIDDFNSKAETVDSQYEAVIDTPSEDSIYGYDLFDVVIRNKLTGEKLESYQIIYGNDLQETIDLVNAASTAGQTIIVPEEMLDEVKSACPFKDIAAHIGGTGRVTLEGEPLRLDEAKSLLLKELPIFANQLLDDPQKAIKDFAENAYSSGVLSAGLIQGLQKVAQNEEIEDFQASDLVEKALLSKDSNGLKTAVAGALATVMQKRLMDAMPDYVPPSVIANVASIGVENVKVFAQVEQGEITLDEGLDKIGNSSLAMGFELFWNNYAPKGTAFALSWVPLIGKFIGSETVARELLRFVKKPVRALVMAGAQKIAPAVKDIATSVCNKVKNAFNTIKETLFSWW